MTNPPFLSVVVPAYNEERRLPATLERLSVHLARQPFDWEIWVVENGSTDRTADIVRDSARRFPGIHLAQSPARGKGLAVRIGMLRSAGRFRFLCDADLSMPVEEIGRFLPPQIEEIDVAIGSREAAGARRFGEPAYRHLTGRVFSLAVKLLILRGFEDTQCGYTCFRDSVAEDLFSRQRFDGWAFDVEVLYLARKRGYRIREVPIPWYYQTESRIRLVRDSFRMFSDLLRIRWNDWKGVYESQNPELPAKP
jgi:dolichyl-phosphate beta-glucosyltransferase